MAESVMDEIHRLVSIGHWLKAIKLCKDYYGMGLKQAKEYIDMLKKIEY